MRPAYVPRPVWDTLSWKEQDLLEMLSARKFTKPEIKRRLYITTEAGYWKLCRRLREKLKTISAVNPPIAKAGDAP